MRRFHTIVFCLIMLMENLGANAGAQDTLYCGAMSVADCALFTDAIAQMEDVNSAQFTLDMLFSIESDIEEISGSVSFEAEGTFTGARGLLNNALFPIKGLGDVTGVFVEVLNLLAAFDSELTMELQFSDTVAEQIGASSGLLEMRIVDGIGYLNLISQWGGIDLAELSNNIAENPLNIGNSALTGLSDYHAAFDPDILNRYLTVTRGENVEFGDVEAALFTTSFDLRHFLSDPDFQQAVAAQLVADYDLSEAVALDIAVGIQGDFFVTTLRNIVIADPETRFVLGNEFLFQWDIPSSVYVEAIQMNGGSVSERPSRVTFTTSVIVNYEEINQDVEITAPENVEMIEIEELVTLGQ